LRCSASQWAAFAFGSMVLAEGSIRQLRNSYACFPGAVPDYARYRTRKEKSGAT
jgi:hypothetical protein